MSETLSDNGTASYGNSAAGPNRTPARGKHQRQLFPDLIGILREEIDPHFKEVAEALYPRLSNEQACSTLSRNLSGRDHRKIGVHELDVILDVLPDDAEVRVLAAMLARRGFKSPERVPDPVRVQEELSEVKRVLLETATAIQSLSKAVERIEGGVR